MTRSLALSTMGVSLASLDRLRADVLVLNLFEEDRPLRGTAGYCDWRLCGWISGLIQENAFGCRRGEVLLTNTGRRIGAERVLLFGQGMRNQFDRNSCIQAVDLTLRVLKKACLTNVALELPFVEAGSISAADAFRLFFERAVVALPGADIILLGPQPLFSELAIELAAREQSVRLSKPVEKSRAEVLHKTPLKAPSAS
jgi:Cytosol aminopeptidase family, N-terminal domain.